MAIKERIEKYLYETGIPKTKLSQRLGISATYLYKLLNGEKPFSEKVSRKIDEYLKKYGY